jgi:hypothetical protein
MREAEAVAMAKAMSYVICNDKLYVIRMFEFLDRKRKQTKIRR